MYYSNQGVSGKTTQDWLPANTYYPNAKSAMTTLNTNNPAGQEVFSVMLGTNDSAISGPTGAPVSNTTLTSNFDAIINQMLTDFPNCKIFLHYPTWYAPNTHNTSDYEETGINRLIGYFPVIDAIVASYATSNPGHVYAGDKKAFNYFAQKYSTAQTQEVGATGYGDFYLHPNAAGAVTLGNYWATAIYNGLYSPALGASLTFGRRPIQ